MSLWGKEDVCGAQRVRHTPVSYRRLLLLFKALFSREVSKTEVKTPHVVDVGTAGKGRALWCGGMLES